MQQKNDNGFLILAAGKGTRMKNDLPKVLHKVCGKEMISYVVDLSLNFKPKKVGVIVSPDAPETKAFCDKKYGNKISFIDQNERLGTGHAVKISLDFLKDITGNVVCLYGDTPFISEDSVNKLLDSISSDDKRAVCVLGFNPKDPAKYGRLKLNDNKDLIEIVEYNDASEEERKIGLCNSGVVAINGKYIHDLTEAIDNNNSKQEYYLTDIVKIAVDKGFKCSSVVADEEEVLGINSQTERVDAEKMKQNDLRNKFLENGVIIQSPETVFFSVNTKIEAGVEIEPFVTFHGDVTVKKGTKIRSYSYIEDCTIGKNNVIGPYARIRPGTKLSEDVKVGNFVEVKKATIGKGSKVNHLTYIGDAEIADNVNIGAGTITCNYDGKNKFKTIIDSNSFIGSNSSLVAPVKIGKNCTIGAGTTVLKDVSDNKRVINRKSQEEI